MIFDLIFMIIAGKTKNRRILKLMASISKLVQSKDFLKKIREEKEKNIIKSNQVIYGLFQILMLIASWLTIGEFMGI